LRAGQSLRAVRHSVAHNTIATSYAETSRAFSNLTESRGIPKTGEQ
jgi:hypothetical protein